MTTDNKTGPSAAILAASLAAIAEGTRKAPKKNAARARRLAKRAEYRPRFQADFGQREDRETAQASLDRFYQNLRANKAGNK